MTRVHILHDPDTGTITCLHCGATAHTTDTTPGWQTAHTRCEPNPLFPEDHR
jgi:hypothetical protein